MLEGLGDKRGSSMLEGLGDKREQHVRGSG